MHPLPLPAVAAATAWLQAEHTTLRATQRAAAAAGNPAVVWHLAWALDTFYRRRGHRHDALASWQAALHAAAHLPDPAARLRTHRSLGHACAVVGLHEEATGHLDQALELAVRHHDLAQQGYTHQAPGVAWRERGDNRRALEHARHALDIYCGLDLAVVEADALAQVGWYAAGLGEFDTARDHCVAALALHRRHGDPGGEAGTLDSLGFIAHRIGDHQQAVEHYLQALTVLRALGHTCGTRTPSTTSATRMPPSDGTTGRATGGGKHGISTGNSTATPTPNAHNGTSTTSTPAKTTTRHLGSPHPPSEDRAHGEACLVCGLSRGHGRSKNTDTIGTGGR